MRWHPDLRHDARRVTTFLGAVLLLASPAALVSSVGASAATSSVPVVCANVVSSTTVYVDDVLSFGAAPGGCSVVSNSSSGNLDRVSDSGFVAFAAGSGTVSQLMTDGVDQYLNQVNVTILGRPDPTPTPDPTSSPTSTGSSTAAPGSATPPGSGTSQPDPLAPVPTTPPTAATADPRRWQQLTESGIAPAAIPGQESVWLQDASGNPMRVLSFTDPSGRLQLTDPGIDYATRPANWQRLGYGDLCWTYSGFGGATGVLLPVADPPLPTVAGPWTLTAAMLGTSTGFEVFTTVQPGDIVAAGGRSIETVTLCSTARPASDRAVAAANKWDSGNPGNSRVWCHVPIGQGPNGPGHVVGGGGGHANHPYDYLASEYGGTCSRGLPTVTRPPTSPATARPTPSTATDPLVTYCRATTDPTRPYVQDQARLSTFVTPPYDSAPYPQSGWTAVVPPRGDYPGQNYETYGRQLLADGCRVPAVVPSPTPSPTSPPASASPVSSPSASTPAESPKPSITVTPEPQVTITGTSTLVIPTEPPVVVSGCGTEVYPSPPLVPVALFGNCVPDPILPPQATPTPYPTPTPTAPSTTTSTATPTAMVTPPVQQTPTPVPSTTAAVPTPTSVVIPALIIPTTPPGGGNPQIDVVSGPTPSPEPSTSAPSPEPPTTNASSAPPEPTSSPDATAVTGSATIVLTNGPSVVTVTVPVVDIISVATPAIVPSEPGDPTGGLADTGSSWAPWLSAALALLGLGLLVIPLRRRG